MLKQILTNKIKEKEEGSSLQESFDDIMNNSDPEVEMVLPVIAHGEHEYDEYRFILKQLKRRNPLAFKKIVNLD